jgi:DNA topoisomerase-1
MQATGRDARGRKQYRYHPAWRDRRGADKFDRMIEFGEALARLRRRCDADLRRRGLPREKILAAVVRLLELTLIRVGNEAYARLNRSFGLTTLRDRHATVTGSRIRFRFRSKSGVMLETGLRDRRLASIARAGAVPVRRRRWRGPWRRLRGRQRLHPRGDRWRVHGQGRPDLGGHGAGVPHAP